MHEQSDIAEKLDQLAADFVAKHKAGEHPQVEDYAERYPEIAEDIRQLFPTLLVFERLKPTPSEIEDGAVESVSNAQPTISSYRILREIGRGGMGVVYEAEQLALQRKVALKVLPPGSATDLPAVQRFEIEARAAAGLHHSNIVPVFDVGRENDCCYYAMQYIEGEGLDCIIRDLQRIKTGNSQPATDKAFSNTVRSLASLESGTDGWQTKKNQAATDTKTVANQPGSKVGWPV